jgi:hypothetical protein
VLCDQHFGSLALAAASACCEFHTLLELLRLPIFMQNGSTPLHWAAWNGHENVLRLLLEAGTNVSLVNKVCACDESRRRGKLGKFVFSGALSLILFADHRMLGLSYTVLHLFF